MRSLGLALAGLLTVALGATTAQAQQRTHVPARMACLHAKADDDAQTVIAACTEALESGSLGTPSNVIRARFVRANYYLDSTHDYTRAVADYNVILERAPRFAPALVSRGVAYMYLDDYPRALADLDRAVQIQRRLPFAYFVRGMVYHRMGDYERALADYDRAVDGDRNDPQYANQRCWLRTQHGRELDRALTDCDRSLQIADRYEARSTRGLLHLRRGEWQAALADYDAALAAKHDDADSLYGRGIARLRLGQTENGQADIAAASAMDAHLAEEFAGYGLTP